MRLVKYLTLAIPMSRNQAKFFIKRGRAVSYTHLTLPTIPQV